MDRIVVGVDGSACADAALRFAVEEARAHGATLEVVMAWTYLDQHRPGKPDADFDPDYHQDDADEALAAIVERVLDPDPGVEIVERAIQELPATALLKAAEDADLVIVGSRGLGGFRGLLLGSVSQQVASHAPCPVVVYREPTEGS